MLVKIIAWGFVWLAVSTMLAFILANYFKTYGWKEDDDVNI